MGQTMSCQLAKLDRKNLFQAVKEGDTEQVKLVLQARPCLVKYSRWFFRRFTALHLAACEGQLEVLKVLLDHGGAVDALDRFGKTPLMLACKRGNWACALQLLDTGASVIAFGSSRERSCLHYAASGGNVDCVKRILQQVAASRDMSVRFVNAYDRCGITALHLASLGSHLTVVRVLLEAGASLTAAGPSSNQYNGLCKGRRPLHYAARGGSVECVKELLAWGADRRCRDNDGYTAYDVAVSYHNFACAAFLDPTKAEPLVWPSLFKFISQVDPEARTVLEAALRKANGTDSQTPTCSQELGMSKELCNICFERACTLQVGECGHRLCATCTLMLCCHSKPDSSSPPRPPLCPFCRGHIGSILLVSSVSRFKLKSSSGRIADTSWICSSYKVPVD